MAYTQVCSWQVDAYGNLARKCSNVWQPDPVRTTTTTTTTQGYKQPAAYQPTYQAPAAPRYTYNGRVYTSYSAYAAAVNAQKQALAYQARVRQQQAARAAAARRAYEQARERARQQSIYRAKALREAERRRKMLEAAERRRREAALAAARARAYEALQARLKRQRQQAFEARQQAAQMQEQGKIRDAQQGKARTQLEERRAAFQRAQDEAVGPGAGIEGAITRRTRQLTEAAETGEYDKIFTWMRDAAKRTGGRYLDEKLYQTAMVEYNKRVAEVSTGWEDLVQQINDLGAKGDWKAAQRILDSPEYRRLESEAAKLKGDGRVPGQVQQVAELTREIAEQRDAYLERVFLGIYAGRGRELAMPADVRLYREKFREQFGGETTKRRGMVTAEERAAKTMTLRKWAEVQFKIQERASERWAEMSISERYRELGLRFQPKVGWTMTDKNGQTWVLKKGMSPFKGDQFNVEAFEPPGAGRQQARLRDILGSSTGRSSFGDPLAHIAELANRMEGASYVDRRTAERELVQYIERAVDAYFKREGLNAPLAGMAGGAQRAGRSADAKDRLVAELLGYFGVERPGGIIGALDRVGRAPILGQLLGGLDLARSGVWAGLWDARVALHGRDSLGTVELPTAFFTSDKGGGPQLSFGQEDATTGKNVPFDLTQAWDYSNQDEIQGMYDEYRRVMDDPNSTVEERVNAIMMVGSMGRTGNSTLLFDAATDPLNFLAVGRFLRAGKLATGEAGGLRAALAQFDPRGTFKPGSGFKMPGLAPVLKDFDKFVTPAWFGPNGALRMAQTTEATVYRNLARAAGVSLREARALPIEEVQELLKRLARGQDIDEIRGAMPGLDRFLEGKKLNTQQLTSYAEAEIIRQQRAVVHPTQVRSMVEDALREQEIAERALADLQSITLANTARQASGSALQKVRAEMAAKGIEPMAPYPVTPKLKGGHVVKLNRLQKIVETAMADRLELARRTAVIAKRIQGKETLDTAFRQLEYRQLEDGLREMDRYRDLPAPGGGTQLGAVGQAQANLRKYRQSLGLEGDERPGYGRWFDARWSSDRSYIVSQIRFARQMRGAAKTDAQRRIWQGRLSRLYAAVDGLQLEKRLSEGGTGVSRRVMKAHGADAVRRFSPNRVARPITHEQGLVEETAREIYARLQNSELFSEGQMDDASSQAIGGAVRPVLGLPAKTQLPQFTNLQQTLGQKLNLGEALDVVRGLRAIPGAYEWWKDPYDSLLSEAARASGRTADEIEQWLDAGHSAPSTHVVNLSEYRALDKAVQTAIRTARKGRKRTGNVRAVSGGGGEGLSPNVLLDSDELALLVKSRVLRAKGVSVAQYDEIRTALGDISRRDLTQRGFWKQAGGDLTKYLSLRERRRSREAFYDIEEYANRPDRIGMTDEEIWTLWSAEHSMEQTRPSARLITPYMRRTLERTFEGETDFGVGETHLVARLLGGQDIPAVGARKPKAGEFGGLLDSETNLPVHVVPASHSRLNPQGAFKGFPRMRDRTPDEKAGDGFRIVVGGDRNFFDNEFVVARLEEVYAKHPDMVVVTGGGRGVDQMAEAWAVKKGVRVERQQADWINEGRKAGGQRNQAMMRSNIKGTVIFEYGEGDEVVSPVGTSLKRAADQAKVPIWKPKGASFRKLGERQLTEEAAKLQAALPEMRRLAGLEFQVRVSQKWIDESLEQLENFYVKVQRGQPDDFIGVVGAAQVERAIRTLRAMKGSTSTWVALGKMGRFDELFDAADITPLGEAMKSRRRTGKTPGRGGWDNRWVKRDETADPMGRWDKRVSEMEARLEEIDELLNGPRMRHRALRGLTVSNDGIYVAENSDAVTVAHELFHAYWDDPANVLLKSDVQGSLTGLGGAARTDIWQRIRVAGQPFDEAEMAAELYALWRMGDDVGSFVRTSWNELLDSQDAVTRFQLEVLGSRFENLGQLTDRWGFGVNHPPLGNRAQMRKWLVDSGFWTPHTAEEIRSGARVWSIEDERQFWESNYAYTPPWTDPDVLRPLLESPEAYFDQFRQWGFFDDDFDQLIAGQTTKAMSAGDRMVFGGDGVKAARSLEEMREWMKARYGELVHDPKTNQFVSAPWLMDFEEYSLWFGRQLGSIDGLRQLGLDIDQTLVSPTELGHLAKTVRELTAKHLARFKDRIQREGGDPELWLPEERKRLAYDIVDALLADKGWMKSLDKAGLVERSQLIGQLQRLFIVWTPAFPIMNAIDAFGPKAALLSIMKNRGRWIYHTEDRWDEWVPDLASVGDDLVPTWGHARLNPWLKIGDDRFNAAEQLKGFGQGIVEAPLRISAKAEGVLRLNFARSVAGRTIDDLIKTGMDPETALLFGRFEAHKALKSFFAVLDHAPAWEKILNQIVPFFTYTYKNALMGLRILVEAPWIASNGARLGQYIDGMNRRNWAENHPGEAFPDQYDSEKLWIESPSGTTYTIDLGMFSDWTRAMKGLADPSREILGVNGFLRIPHPWQTALLGLFTGQETSWGAEAGLVNLSPWFELFEWLEQGGQAAFDPNNPESMNLAQMVSKMLFFKEFGRIPPVATKIQTFFTLMETDEDQAWAYYEANPDIEGYFQLNGANPRNMFDTKKWSWHAFASDADIARYETAMKGLDDLNAAYDEAAAQYYMEPWSREYRQLKLERRAAVASYIAAHPVLEEAWMWSKARDWLAEGLEGFQTDLLIDDFFSIKAPKRSAYASDLAYQEANLAYIQARQRFLQQNPSVADTLFASQNAVERAWFQHELQWSEILEDQARIRIQIAREEARLDPNRDKLEVLYRISDANYARLDQEAFGQFYDELGVDLIDNQPSFVRTLLNRGLGRVQQMVSFPGRADYFYEIATDAERQEIVVDEKYYTEIGDLMSELKSKDDFSTFWSEMKRRGLLARYLKENPGKRIDFEYATAISRIFAAGQPIKFWDRLMAEPHWLNEYLRRNPEKQATYQRILTGKRYFNGLQALWGRIGNDFSRFYDELAKDPWLQGQYFARHPEKVGVGRGGSGGMSAYGIAISDIFRRAKDGRDFYRLLQQQPQLMSEYFRRHPDRAAKFRAGQEYFQHISGWVNALKRDDFVGAQRLWNAMPSWVHERYFARHPDSGMRDGIGSGESRDRRTALQSSEYAGLIGRWVELLRESKFVEADEYFRQLPSWAQERYFTNHPDQRAKHELTSEMLRAGAEYFLAPTEDMKLQILQKYPQLGSWLKEHGGNEAAWRGLIFAIYRSIPTSEAWLKRKFRESYPELFGQEAVGERRTKRVLEQLAAHPEMVPFYEKAVALQLNTYLEQIKLSRTAPKPLTMERKSRLAKRRKRRAARLHSSWSTHSRLRTF